MKKIFSILFLLIFNLNIYANDALENFLRFSIEVLKVTSYSVRTSPSSSSKKKENQGFYISYSENSGFGKDQYDGNNFGIGYYLENVKVELSFYQMYLKDQSYSDYINDDGFSIHGFNASFILESSKPYLYYFRPFAKIGYGYFTQEYGRIDKYDTPESVKELKLRSDVNLLAGFGVTTYILKTFEIFVATNYYYFFDDLNYGEPFEKNLVTFDYGLIIKF